MSYPLIGCWVLSYSESQRVGRSKHLLCMYIAGLWGSRIWTSKILLSVIILSDYCRDSEALTSSEIKCEKKKFTLFIENSWILATLSRIFYFGALFWLKIFVILKLIFFYLNVPEFSFDCYNSNIIIGGTCLFIKSCMHVVIFNFLCLNQPFSFSETFFISWRIGSNYDQGFIQAYFSN